MSIYTYMNLCIYVYVPMIKLMNDSHMFNNMIVNLSILAADICEYSYRCQ